MRWTRAGGTAVGTAVVLAVVALVAGCADARRGPSSQGPSPASVIGRLWRLAQIGHGGTDLAVPASTRATVQFTGDGAYLASDAVNAISGRYRMTGTGVVCTSSMSTLVGYAGHDPVRLGAIDAMRAVTSGADVGVRVGGLTMTMTVDAYVLTFIDSGPAVVYPSPYGTPSAVSSPS